MLALPAFHEGWPPGEVGNCWTRPRNANGVVRMAVTAPLYQNLYTHTRTRTCARTHTQTQNSEAGFKNGPILKEVISPLNSTARTNSFWNSYIVKHLALLLVQKEAKNTRTYVARVLPLPTSHTLTSPFACSFNIVQEQWHR